MEEKIAEKIFRDSGLFLKKYPNTYVSIRDLENSKYFVFNTNEGIFIESLLYGKVKSLVIDNIMTFTDRGMGYGRKMVEATEFFAKKMGLEHSFIVRNANPPFWDHMKYEKCEDSNLLKITESLNVRIPEHIVYKSLASL